MRELDTCTTHPTSTSINAPGCAGYDVGVISGSLADMASSLDLSTFEQEASTSGLNFVAGVGALIISGNLLDRVGRRATLLASSLLLLVGTVVVTLAGSFGVLLAGRALQGLGSGCSWCAASVYITEIAPSRWRGALVSISDIGINVGILLGYAADRIVNVLVEGGANVRWRVAMGLAATIPLLFVCCFPLMPETPRWLVMAGRDDEARVALRKGECGASEPAPDGRAVVPAAAPSAAGSEAEEEALAQLKLALRGTRELSWYESILPHGAAGKRLTVLVLALGLAQQLTGTEAILYYTPRILDECPPDGPKPAGCSSADFVFLVSIGVGACKLVGELVAAALVERTGRRQTMAVSNLLLSLGVVAIALQLALGGPAAVGAIALCLVMLFFSLGPGPLTFVVVNEIIPLERRAKLVALSVFFNRLGSGTIALTFLSLKESIGDWQAFALYAAVGFAITLFYALAVPDLTGQALEAAGPSSDADAEEGGDRSPPTPALPCEPATRAARAYSQIE